MSADGVTMTYGGEWMTDDGFGKWFTVEGYGTITITAGSLFQQINVNYGINQWIPIAATRY